MSFDNDNHLGFVLEQIADDLKAILEGQEALVEVPGAIATLQQDMDEVKTELKAIRAAVIDHTHQLNHHETRITNLESNSTVQ
jgi:uncharacterized coiled-coil protein SlyX